MGTSTFTVAAFTTGAGTADNASLTTLQYMALLGGTATQLNHVEEVYLAGQAALTSPVIMLMGRSSTVSATPTALSTPNSNGLTHPSGGVITAPAVGSIDATTKPIRSNSVTLAKKTYTFNALAGVVRCNYSNTQDRFGILGNTASLGELTISAFTGSTSSVLSGEIVYETM